VEEHLKYPIGKYQAPSPIAQTHLSQWIEEIAAFPSQLRTTVHGMNEVQLSTPYREGGWTVRQVLHHLPDSHMNAYIRFKWTLTEDTPTIKAYFEDRWAQLEDAQRVPVEIPLNLLDALHARWVALLKTIKREEFKRIYIHPQYGKEYSLEEVLGLYAWHGKHHRAQVEALKSRMGWSKP
jgi:uncharacterized damage-inducible protein DinB